ncbi:RDD family protein [Saccharothrix sp. 6-C]|uniref:RDD family protein n=1 Tax=Saccharothrix sp. 6-C TaxID=2781735 RepID=UPI0019172790|nr:RDD family protein [Saccharothrix sp. 6-C]QQQ77143.1 RDD family protein [Saccharothrix sp. 6-C]
MNAPQPPGNQQFGGHNQQEQGQGAQPSNADATQVVPGGGQPPAFPPPEATQVVPSGPQQVQPNPEATQVVPPGATQQPGSNPYGQPAQQPGSGAFPAQPGSGGFPAQQPPQYGQQPPQQYGQQPPSNPYGQPQQNPYGQQPPSNPYGQPQQNPYGQAPASNPYGQPQQQQQQAWAAQAAYAAQPAYGAPAGGYAEWGSRAVGFLIDYFAPGLIVGVLAGIGAATGDPTIYLILSGIGYLGLLGFIIYNSWYLAGTTGQSMGKKIAKIKLIKEETGQPIGFGNAFVRHLCHFVDSLPCYAGWFAPLWEAKKQTWADKIMGTIVVNAPEGAAPGGYPGGGYGQPQANPYGQAPASNPYGQPQQQNPYGQQPPQQW